MKTPIRKLSRFIGVKKEKTIKTIEADLPVYWACLLINGDNSMFSEYELQRINEYLASHKLDLHCVNVSENTSYRRFNGLITEVATYTFFA